MESPRGSCILGGFLRDFLLQGDTEPIAVFHFSRQSNLCLIFFSRLLADKDSLSSKCTSLASEIQSIEARHEQAIASLKERWAAELKRQKDAWSAAEKIKRDSWAEEKTKEVKELTIKGLEPEIHRLMGKHRADMRKVVGSLRLCNVCFLRKHRIHPVDFRFR